jgi:hypothetical protein
MKGWNVTCLVNHNTGLPIFKSNFETGGSILMETIENKVTSSATITLDEKHSLHCRFANCRLVYSGGDFILTETTLENCQVTLAGPAQRTLNLLGSLGALKVAGPFSGAPPKVQ